jgi:hypothetical protein
MSGGITGISFLAYSSTARVSSELILMSSLASTMTTPWASNSAPTQSTESLVWPIGKPTGQPALNSFSADAR